jgi:glycosyltransferase involved in cell wall biosynthesis
MNIFIFHHYSDLPGGTWTGTYELYRELIPLGNTVTIFSSNFNHYSLQNQYAIDDDMYKIIQYENIRNVFIKTVPYKNNGLGRLLNMISYAINTLRVVRKLKETPDVVIATTPHPFSVLAGYIYSRLNNTLFVVELHDLWTEYIYDNSKSIGSRVISRMLKHVDSIFYKSADLIFYLWTAMDKYLMGYGLNKDKLIWTPLGVSKIVTDEVQQPPKNHLVVTCTARFGPASNVVEILHAGKILMDQNVHKFQFIMAGDGQERQSMEDYVKISKMNNVSFLGMLARDKIPKLLHESDVLIATLPNVRHYNEYGTIPTKLIDYLAAGKPTIFVTGIKDNLLERAGAGYTVAPGDVEGLANTLLKIEALSNTERINMGRKGLDYIRENHFLPSIAKKIDSNLRRVQKEKL